MTADRSRDPLARQGVTPSEQLAAEVGAMVADRVRRAIESAERSADELQRRALDRSTADRADVRRTGAVVLEQIDLVEAKVGELLRGLRDEVVRTMDEGRVEPAVQAQPPAEPEGQAPGPGPEPARRRPFFGRGVSPRCSVCGRGLRAGEETRAGWRRTRKLDLCPDCQHQGWQLPRGARLPFRSTGHDAT
jgi:hypothetical protein